MEAEAMQPALGVVSASADDAASDDELALRAREQYRESGIPEIERDAAVAPLLAPGERLFGHCSESVVLRVQVEEESRQLLRESGELYVTDSRLIHVGAGTQVIDLADIEELSMADNRILLTLTASRGVTIDVHEPHQLRVLIAAAKAASRQQSEG